MIILLMLLHVVVISSILLVGGGWFAAIPFLGLLWLVVSLGVDDNSSSLTFDDIQNFAQRHAMTIAWVCMMLGSRGVVAAWPDIVLEVLLMFISVNILLRGGSHIRGFDTGRNVFQFGYISSLCMLMIHALGYTTWSMRGHLILICILMSTAVRSIFTFVLPALTHKSYRQDQYIFFVLCNSLFLIRIYGWGRNDLSSAVVLAQMYLMILYCLIYAVYWYTSENSLINTTSTDEIVEEILSGKNILGKKRPLIFDTLFQIRDFLLSLDVRTQSVIGSFNIIVVIFQVFIFAKGIGSEYIWMSEILLRFGIAAFFVNYLLLRTIGFGHHMQRVLSFLLVTGGIYLTIIHLFGDDSFVKLSLGVVRTVGSSILLGIVPSTTFGQLLRLDDYKSRIGSIILASGVNIVFLFQMGYHNQLTFSLMLLYIALQIFLILYARSTQIQKKVIY